MEHVKIARGLTMPFFPMRPVRGRRLANKGSVGQLYSEVMEDRLWIVQPKLNGDRACLAVVDEVVFLQNRHGEWYTKPVKNKRAFLKLPSGTCFDGEVYDQNYYPFECLAYHGKSLCRSTAGEREVVAFQLARLIEQPWLFNHPSKRWLQRLGENAPQWEGVVLKRTMSPYLTPGSHTQVSHNWVKRTWT